MKLYFYIFAFFLVFLAVLVFGPGFLVKTITAIALTLGLFALLFLVIVLLFIAARVDIDIKETRS